MPRAHPTICYDLALHTIYDLLVVLSLHVPSLLMVQKGGSSGYSDLCEERLKRSLSAVALQSISSNLIDESSWQFYLFGPFSMFATIVFAAEDLQLIRLDHFDTRIHRATGRWFGNTLR